MALREVTEKISALQLYVEERELPKNLFGKIAQLVRDWLVHFGCIAKQLPMSQEEVREVYEHLRSKVVAGGLNEGEKERLQNLFSNVFGKLDAELFDRKWVDSSVERFLTQPEIDAASERRGVSVAQFQTLLRRRPIDAALKLGVRPTIDRIGNHGSLIYWNCQGKQEAIFKPFSAPTLFQTFFPFKWLVRGQESFLWESGLEALRYTDRAAYLLDQKFEFQLSPRVDNTELEGRPGALVFWEHGCTSSQKKTVGLDFFQRLAVFDYLLGNLDRHEENWLVKQDGGILAIDNTHTFIGDYVGTHFRDWPLRRFHYRWKHHPLATEPFKDKAKEKIKELTERKVEEFWRDLEHEFGRGNPLLEGKRKELFLERVKVLQKMGSEGGAPRQLGELFSKEAIHRYLFA